MYEALSALINTNPIYLPLPAVADFLGMDPASLRASIEQGRCPFGFCWKIGVRAGFKIPTATFLAWYLKGVPTTALSL